MASGVTPGVPADAGELGAPTKRVVSSRGDMPDGKSCAVVGPLNNCDYLFRGTFGLFVLGLAVLLSVVSAISLSCWAGGVSPHSTIVICLYSWPSCLGVFGLIQSTVMYEASRVL